jgi:hypothetical protein
MKDIHNIIKEKEDLEKPLKQMIAVIHKRSIELQPVFFSIIQKSKKTRIDFLMLVGHFTHMMLNRLFYEKARVHEVLIYDFLRRYYASEIARSKHTANKCLIIEKK